MSYCKYCGKQLPDGVNVCECSPRVQQTPAIPFSPAAAESGGGVTAPVTPAQSPAVNNDPVNVTVPVAPQEADEDGEYLELTKKCKLINILAIVLWIAGLVSLVLINGWVAAVMFFVGELFVLVPNTGVQKLYKAKNPTADKKIQRSQTSEIIKRLKAKDKNFKLSFVIAIVCLVSIIASFIVPPFFGASESDSSYESSIEGEGAVVSATELDNDSEDEDTNSNKTDSEKSDNVVKEPIVGSFDYYETTNTDTMQKMAKEYPYISHVHFDEDGTGNLTLKTSAQSNGFALYKTTWELVETSGDDRQYVIKTHTNDVIHMNYAGEEDVCFIFFENAGRNLAYTLIRYSGNAQENISGGKATTAHDVVGTFKFAYAKDPTTGSKVTSPTPPYVSYVSLYDGGMCSMLIKDSSGSIDSWFGKWTPDKSQDGYITYKLVMNDGTITKALMYVPSTDTCMLTDSSGALYYYERKAE